MIAQHAQAWKQCFGSRPRSHGRPMPAGGRVCEPEEGPRVVLGALNPMGSVCPYLPCILAACCHAMAHTRLRPGLLCLGGQDQPGGSVLVQCDPRQHPPPAVCKWTGGEGGGGRLPGICISEPKTRPGVDQWSSLWPVPIKPPLQRQRPGLWIPDCHMSRNKTCGPASGC
jgi:hypothetical protein